MQGTNLNDILVFLAVVDTGSFAAGGKATGVSRSAAGKAIVRLERHLGTRLLNRTTRTLSLTHEGEVFRVHGLSIAEAIAEAEASVAGGGRTPRGTLRLTIPDAFGRMIVMPVLAQFLKDWPEVQVEVSLTDRLVEIVDDGLDLAIRIGVTQADSTLVSRVVARYPIVLCAAPDYLAIRGEPRAVADLAQHDCLYFTSHGQRQAWKLRDALEGMVKAPGRSRLRLDTGEAIRGAALAGLGIAYLPRFLVETDLSAGTLKSILPDATADSVDIVALYPSKRLLEPRVRHFIDMLVSRLAA